MHSRCSDGAMEVQEEDAPFYAMQPSRRPQSGDYGVVTTNIISCNCDAIIMSTAEPLSTVEEERVSSLRDCGVSNIPMSNSNDKRNSSSSDSNALSTAVDIANIAAQANAAAAVGLIGEDYHREIHCSLQVAVDQTHSDDARSAEAAAHAVARLQAATRGMIARKAFTSIRKQTMASLVIQRFAMNALRENRQSQSVPEPPAPTQSI